MADENAAAEDLRAQIVLQAAAKIADCEVSDLIAARRGSGTGKIPRVFRIAQWYLQMRLDPPISAAKVARICRRGESTVREAIPAVELFLRRGDRQVRGFASRLHRRVNAALRKTKKEEAGQGVQSINSLPLDGGGQVGGGGKRLTPPLTPPTRGGESDGVLVSS